MIQAPKIYYEHFFSYKLNPVNELVRVEKLVLAVFIWIYIRFKKTADNLRDKSHMPFYLFLIFLCGLAVIA
jgi:hypothetical protein